MAKGLLNRWVTLILILWVVLIIYIIVSSSKPDVGALSDATALRLEQALAEITNMKQQNEQLRQLADQLKDSKVRSLSNQVRDINNEMNDIQKQLKNDADNAPRGAYNMGAEAVAKIKALQSQLEQLRNPSTSNGSASSAAKVPGADHEELRRRVENGVIELGYYIDAQLKRLQGAAANVNNLAADISSLAVNAGKQRRTILNDLQLLGSADGAGAWRAREHQELSDIMQSRIHSLQNPADCSAARKLVCNLNKGCGYGCQLHHAIYCFMVAYGTRRTMVLQSSGWRYASGGWESVFKPISNTCASPSDQTTYTMWRGEQADENTKVVMLPIVDSLSGRPPYMPLSIPEDLSERLLRLHGHPAVWFIGQFVRYMLRPQPRLAEALQSTLKAMDFKNPIVGVHVRRTDKVGTEAAFHGIEEYMVHIEEYYNRLELQRPVDARRVYLASDDPDVLEDARKKYPKYTFIGDVNIAKSAGLDQRYGEESLLGVIKDIHFLSLTDYLVCTFSSQVCRVAYEIMNAMHPDASTWFHSLDDIYYFGGQNAHEQIAMYAHTAEGNDEIDLQPGDVVGVAGNHWDGFSKGHNRRTGRVGLYPSYKVRDKTVIVKYPAYSDVNVVHHD